MDKGRKGEGFQLLARLPPYENAPFGDWCPIFAMQPDVLDSSREIGNVAIAKRIAAERSQ
jgi:hypothetical protein